MNPGTPTTDRANTGTFHRSFNNTWLSVPLLAITLLILAACTPASSPAPELTIPPQELLEQTRRAMNAVQSYSVSIDSGVSNYNGGKPAPMARGQWAAPNDYRLRFEIVGPDDGSLREIISAGDRTLFINSDGFQWEIGQEIQPSYPFNLTIILDLPDLVHVKLQGEAEVDGVAVYHITGLPRPGEDAEDGEISESVTGYDLYIGKEDLLLQRLRTSVEMNFAPREMRVTRTTVYNYFDYNVPVEINLPPVDPCNRSREPGRWLDCGGLPQRVYWLGERLAIPGAPILVLDRAWIDDAAGDRDGAVLTILYSAEDTSVLKSDVAIKQWRPAAWKEYLANLPNPDPEILPPGGQVNWWQNPCVEEEVYQQANGAEVHLFQVHLPSLIYIYPMSKEHISRCMNEPVGAVGVHVYFEETVIEFSVQDSVSPAGPPARVLVPGDTSRADAPQPYPELVLNGRNPYNEVETVRLIAASLKPYDYD